MAESTVPAAKKAKRSAPLSRVTAKEREKQFKTEFNADGGVVLFCRFCEHGVDFTHGDTIDIIAQGAGIGNESRAGISFEHYFAHRTRCGG